MQYYVPNTPLMYCHLNLKAIKKIQNREKKKVPQALAKYI